MLTTTPHAFSDKLIRAKIEANAANEICENTTALLLPESSINDDCETA